LGTNYVKYLKIYLAAYTAGHCFCHLTVYFISLFDSYALGLKTQTSKTTFNGLFFILYTVRAQYVAI